MHPFLRAYQARQTLLTGDGNDRARPYYQASEIRSGITRPTVYNASSYASQNKSIEKKKKKRRKKENSSGSESYSSSSESDGEGNRRSKKNKNRCWKGYKPAKGKAAYAEDSCVKA